MSTKSDPTPPTPPTPLISVAAASVAIAVEVSDRDRPCATAGGGRRGDTKRESALGVGRARNARQHQNRDEMRVIGLTSEHPNASKITNQHGNPPPKPHIPEAVRTPLPEPPIEPAFSRERTSRSRRSGQPTREARTTQVSSRSNAVRFTQHRTPMYSRVADRRATALPAVEGDRSTTPLCLGPTAILMDQRSPRGSHVPPAGATAASALIGLWPKPGVQETSAIGPRASPPPRPRTSALSVWGSQSDRAGRWARARHVCRIQSARRADVAGPWTRPTRRSTARTVSPRMRVTPCPC